MAEEPISSRSDVYVTAFCSLRGLYWSAPKIALLQNKGRKFGEKKTSSNITRTCTVPVHASDDFDSRDDDKIAQALDKCMA